METFCLLRQKEVINIRDGYRFGFVDDLEIDFKTGKIIKLILPVPGGFLCIIGTKKEYRIPWSCIKKIGEDIILVDVCIDDVIMDRKCC